MSTKAQSLPVAVRLRIRMWQVFALVIVFATAATLALTLGRSSVSTTRAPAKGIAPAHAVQVGGGGQFQSHAVQVGGGGQLQYKPLP